MANSTLAAIRTKIRRITRSPSPNQITDAEIDEYVNTFVLYDFPEHLRLFSLRTVLSFYTQPFVDVYETNTTNPLDPLYDFKNRYISIHPPIYIAGYNVRLSQDRQEFFAGWPQIESIVQIGTGDGVTLNPVFTGTLPGFPILQNQVLFDAIQLNYNGISIIDDPQSNGSGNLVEVGTGIVRGTINYVTGNYSVTFPGQLLAQSVVNSQTVPYVQNRPISMLFYDQKFTLRPVPDQPYKVEMEAYIRPTELLSSAQNPEFNEWWQYIAYGAAKKIFEDRSDMDSVQIIMPEFKEQESLVLRRTLVQQANDRASTIYVQQVGHGFNYGWWNGSPLG